MRDLTAGPWPGWPGWESLGTPHAGVLPARTADRHCHEMLATALVAIQRDLEHVEVGPDEFLRAWLSQHVVPDGLVLSVLGRELRNPVRVRQETAVGDHISVDRQAVLEAKRQDDHPHRRVALVAERLTYPRPQLMDVHGRRVEYQVGLCPDALQLVTLSGDPVDDAAVLLH